MSSYVCCPFSFSTRFEYFALTDRASSVARLHCSVFFLIFKDIDDGLFIIIIIIEHDVPCTPEHGNSSIS